MSPSDFPGLGHTLLADFGDDGPWGPFATELEFRDADTLGIRVVRGALQGVSDTVPYQVTPIREDVWVVRWQETRKITVSQVHDFTEGRVVANITVPDQRTTFVQLEGSLQRR